ncbi:lipopolysaccharide biosynthesis protein [Paenibacillus sp. YYML68]|uniref:lipopolysaccharide biosynthesis protein n=1 Tax=Paenibacillus sp. YYML68 TaxID=2909250 RepID=UPI0024911CD1|nr:oligosaccharide flippase family protein [Paenibacillus sp. YYML68]
MKKNILLSFVNYGCYYFSQWLIIVLLARFTTKEDLGVFSLALAICVPMFYFFGLSFKSVMSTDQAIDSTVSNYLSIRLFSFIPVFLLTISIAFLFDYAAYLKIFMLVFAWKLLEFVSDVIHGYFQSKEYFFKLTIAQIIKASLVIVCSFVVLLFYPSVVAILYTLIVVYLVGLIVELVMLLKPGIVTFQLDLKGTVSVLKRTYPLAFVVLISNLFNNVPRYMLEQISLEAVGVFSAVYYFAVIGSSVINSISQALLPRLSKYYNLGERNKYNQILKKSTLVSVGLGVGWLLITVIFGDQLLYIIFGEEYMLYQSLLVYLSVGMLFLYSSIFIGTSLHVAGQYHQQLKINVASLVVLCISSFLAIGHFGLDGAGIAIMLTNLFHSILIFTVYSYKFKWTH